MAELYWEDLRVGMRQTTGEVEVTTAGIKEFAARYDPQGFHLDEAAAQASIFCGLAASGWHTAALTMRLMVEGGFRFAGGSVGLGGEIEWPRPTRPGDRLHVESEIVEMIPSRSKPRQGIARARNVTLNQRGEPVQIFTAKILVFRRGVL